MSERKRVLICEFHQESDTFNPLISTLENCFEKVRCAEGQEAYDMAKLVPCALHGMIDAVEEFGGELILSQSLSSGDTLCLAVEEEELVLRTEKKQI